METFDTNMYVPQPAHTPGEVRRAHYGSPEAWACSNFVAEPSGDILMCALNDERALHIVRFPASRMHQRMTPTVFRVRESFWGTTDFVIGADGAVILLGARTPEHPLSLFRLVMEENTRTTRRASHGFYSVTHEKEVLSATDSFMKARSVSFAGESRQLVVVGIANRVELDFYFYDAQTLTLLSRYAVESDIVKTIRVHTHTANGLEWREVFLFCGGQPFQIYSIARPSQTVISLANNASSTPGAGAEATSPNSLILLPKATLLGSFPQLDIMNVAKCGPQGNLIALASIKPVSVHFYLVQPRACAAVGVWRPLHAVQCSHLFLCYRAPGILTIAYQDHSDMTSLTHRMTMVDVWVHMVPWRAAVRHTLVPKEFRVTVRTLAWLRGAGVATASPGGAGTESVFWSSLPLEVFEYAVAIVWDVFLWPLVQCQVDV